MGWYVEVLKKYAVFSGRARRAEYWMFFLVNLIIQVALFIVDKGISTYPALITIYGLAVLLPGLAVGVRRLHDTGRSGWWILIALIPFVGSIILIVLFALEGEPDSNAYGPNPKAVTV